MIIDFSTPILGIHGEPVVVGDRPVLLRTVVQSALIELQVEADANMAPGTKADFFRLAMLANGDRVSISLDDAQTIKNRVDQVMTPLVVGRVREILDPPTEVTVDAA